MSEGYHKENRVVHNRRVLVVWSTDPDIGPPWKECDGHGPVRQAQYPHRSQRGQKLPGERPLNDAGRHNNQYFYDWQSAMKIAEKDGWGSGIDSFTKLMCKHRRVPTKGMVAEAAVQSDFDYLSGWLNDDWHYCEITVIDLETDVERSLWGIESDCDDHHNEIISELADDMWDDVLKALLGVRAA